MERINVAVSWYQAKIGAYDKQLWEKSVEERVLKSIAQVPKKNARVKPELIDVDLVRGSTFTKAKPQHGWLAVSRQGLLRLLLLPVFFTWWERQTTRWFTVTISLLYVLQVATTIAYVTDSGEAINNETLSSAHVIVPWILMLVLGLMHSQIVATRLSHKHHHRPKNKRRSKSRKRKIRSMAKKTASGRESGSPETGGETHLEEESSGGHEQHSCKGSTNRGGDRLKDGISSRKQCLADSLFPKFQQNRNCKDASEASDEQYFEGDESDSIPAKDGHSQGYNPIATVSSENSGAKQKVPIEVVVTDQVTCQNRCNDCFCTACRCSTLGNSTPEYSTLECSRQEFKPQRTEKLSLDGLQSTDHRAPNQTALHSNPGLDHDGATRNSHENLLLCNQPVRDFTGELILPEQDIEGVRLTDDLIISCDVGNIHPNNSATGECPQLDKEANPPRHLPCGANKNRLNFGGCSDVIHVGSSQGCISIKNTSLVDLNLLGSAATVNAKSGHHVLSSSEKHMSRGYHQRLPGALSRTLVGESSHARYERQHETSPVRLTKNMPFPAGTNEDTDGEDAKMPPMFLRRRRWGPSQDRPPEGVQVKEGLSENNLSVKIVDRKESTGLSSCESEADTPNTPISLRPQPVAVTFTEDTDVSSDGQTSELEWEDTMHSEVTSSDSSSCSSETVSSDREVNSEDPFRTTHLHSSSSVLNNLASSSDKVSCMIWEGEQLKKVDLTVLDIGWTIIQKVDNIPQMCDYVVLGVLFALVFMFMPVMYRSYHARLVWPSNLTTLSHILALCQALFGTHWRIQVVVINGAIQRFFLALIFFFLLSVADRTFKQRLLYAKNFCYLTSSRRARKYDLPHFRLNKVRNIKTWLSLRSYLKKRGPQRSVDSIVSAAFLLAVTFVSLMCLKLLQDSGGFLDHLGNWELVLWCMALAIYLLRFMTLGTKINRKYRNFSVLITEQINLYLHMEQKPRKKDELMLANNVLKLAEDLLKELESPFKISGLSANPFLYNITKVIVLSAFSAVLTELLGFKLKLYKIKLRP